MTSSIVSNTNQDEKGIVYNHISSGSWALAISALKQYPEKASEWIVRNTFNEQTNEEEECRVLPLHTACALNPPIDLIQSLLHFYPEGASFPDNQGLYPLHYACGNLASAEVIEHILYAFPKAIKLADPHAMLPLHHMALWGISSPKALDVVLMHCDDEVYLHKDMDSSTPLDLAFVSEENDHVDYIIAELEARYPNESVQDNESMEMADVLQDTTVSNTSQDSENNSLYDKRFSNDEDPELVMRMEMEIKSLKKKLEISDKENKMLNTYRTQNKSLESSLSKVKKELDEYKQKYELFQNEKDVLDSYKTKSQSLDSEIKSLNEELLRFTRKSERLEHQNDKINARVTKFTHLIQLMYNSMKPVLETDEGFLEVRENLPDLTKSVSKDATPLTIPTHKVFQ